MHAEPLGDASREDGRCCRRGGRWLSVSRLTPQQQPPCASNRYSSFRRARIPQGSFRCGGASDSTSPEPRQVRRRAQCCIGPGPRPGPANLSKPRSRLETLPSAQCQCLFSGPPPMGRACRWIPRARAHWTRPAAALAAAATVDANKASTAGGSSSASHRTTRVCANGVHGPGLLGTPHDDDG